MLALDCSIGAVVGMSGWLPFRRDLRQVVGVDQGADGDFFEEEDRGGDDSGAPSVVAFERELLDLNDSIKDPTRTSMSTPVFVSHGARDGEVVPERGNDLVETFGTAGYDVTWKVYEDLWHAMNGAKVQDMVDFVKNRLEI